MRKIRSVLNTGTRNLKVHWDMRVQRKSSASVTKINIDYIIVIQNRSLNASWNIIVQENKKLFYPNQTHFLEQFNVIIKILLSVLG
jgi:hypothetical protein